LFWSQKENFMKKYPFILFFCFLGCFFSAPISSYGVESAPRITDREIIESLTRLEEGVKANRVAITSLRSDIGSLRSDIGSLRSDMRALRSEILDFMRWGFGLLFSGMLILVGFILWDRRSTLTPIKNEIDDLERQKVNRIIEAMKKLSEKDSGLAEVLRSVGLL